jgi:hypothetical protein
MDRQTDMAKLIVAFRNFANAPKNLIFYWVRHTSVLKKQRLLKSMYIHIYICYFHLNMPFYSKSLRMLALKQMFREIDRF